MAWLDGTLLERNSKGEVRVGDKVENDEAEQALQNGETVGFTVGGKLVSTMKLEGGTIVEKLVQNPTT